MPSRIQGGNALKVTLLDYSTNLHSVWDSGLIFNLLKESYGDSQVFKTTIYYGPLTLCSMLSNLLNAGCQTTRMSWFGITCWIITPRSLLTLSIPGCLGEEWSGWLPCLHSALCWYWILFPIPITICARPFLLVFLWSTLYPSLLIHYIMYAHRGIGVLRMC